MLRFLACLAAAALACTAHARTLRIASQNDPGTMDPHAIATLYNNRVLSQVYETLVERDEQFDVAPRLALSWTVLDKGAGWRFKLRPNVRFHDGAPFTADDVVFNVKRALDPLSAMKSTLPEVTGARKVDELTVDILTAQPVPVLPRTLMNLRMMSRAWAAKHKVERPQDFRAKEETFAARNANGTGPFRLVSWEPDVRTVLAAHPGYWGQRGHVTEAHFLVVGSAATRVAGLVSGEIDLVIDPAVQDIVRLRAAPNVAVRENTGLGTTFLGFHHQRDDIGPGAKGNPFKDIRVRRAVRAAIDLEALRSKVLRDTATVGRALYSPALEGYDARFSRPWKHDPAAGRALLAEAGIPDGFAVELDCSAQQPVDSACQAVAGMLSRIGIRVTHRPLQFNVLVPRLVAGESSLYAIGWTSPTGEPEGVLVPLARTRAAGLGEYNVGRYSNPKVDELIDQARREFDADKRHALFTAAMALLHEDAAFVPLFTRKVTWAMRNHVQVTPRPNDQIDLRFVTLAGPAAGSAR
jgi:peptide/nickel transport system substrate-binding protein